MLRHWPVTIFVLVTFASAVSFGAAVPNFAPNPPSAADAESVCRSPELLKVAAQVLAERGFGPDSIQSILENLRIDQSADANSFKRTYARLKVPQQLGHLEVCGIPFGVPGAGELAMLRILVFSAAEMSGVVALRNRGEVQPSGIYFGQLNSERYSTLVAAMHTAESAPIEISGGRGKTLCDNINLRKLAAQGVADTLALNGLPMPAGLRGYFNALAVDSSDRAMALKRTILREKPDIGEVTICLVPNNEIPNFMQTVIVHSGRRLGGYVLNFGIPGAVAPFGDQF